MRVQPSVQVRWLYFVALYICMVTVCMHTLVVLGPIILYVILAHTRSLSDPGKDHRSLLSKGSEVNRLHG